GCGRRRPRRRTDGIRYRSTVGTRSGRQKPRSRRPCRRARGHRRRDPLPPPSRRGRTLERFERMKLRTLSGIGAIAGIALATLVGRAPANAHNAFVSSSPASGDVVTEQPGTVVITTSDALLDSGLDSPTTFLQVRGPG